MSKKKFIIAIPARLNSKRLPGKALEKIGDYTMIYRVMKNVLHIPIIEKIFLCTDNELIAKEANGLPISVIYRSGKFSSGTDRIHASIQQMLESLNLPKDFNINNIYIINVQADQPFIEKKLINKFINYIELLDNPELVTAYYEKEINSLTNSSDEVKLTISQQSKRVLYFSRSSIPYFNKYKNNEIMHSKKYYTKYHIGVYAYRFDILRRWSKLANSQLEKLESLEQLRWLENDIPIYAFKYTNEILSVDNINQLEKARSMILE
tara:strand:+ start:6 stop:800 length:795 start_codon:yes stop_codon:yes gene_type:complete